MARLLVSVAEDNSYSKLRRGITRVARFPQIRSRCIEQPCRSDCEDRDVRSSLDSDLFEAWGSMHSPCLALQKSGFWLDVIGGMISLKPFHTQEASPRGSLLPRTAALNAGTRLNAERNTNSNNRAPYFSSSSHRFKSTLARWKAAPAPSLRSLHHQPHNSPCNTFVSASTATSHSLRTNRAACQHSTALHQQQLLCKTLNVA